MLTAGEGKSVLKLGKNTGPKRFFRRTVTLTATKKPSVQEISRRRAFSVPLGEMSDGKDVKRYVWQRTTVQKRRKNPDDPGGGNPAQPGGRRSSPVFSAAGQRMMAAVSACGGRAAEFVCARAFCPSFGRERHNNGMANPPK